MWTCAALLLFLAADAAHVQRLLQAGRVEEASRELRELLAAQPSDPSLLNLQGILEAQRGNVTAAIASFQRALAAAPGSASIHANLARAYQQAGNSAMALQSWRRVAELDSANREANYQLAFLLLRQGDSAGALNYLSKLDPLAQGTPQALAVRVAASPDPAALRMLKNHPALTEADVTDVLSTLVLGNRDDSAIELIEALRERSLAGRSSLETLAFLYERQQRWQDARRSLEQVAQTAGKVDLKLLLALARLAYRQGDYQGTLGYLGQARQMEPEHAAVHFFFGMTAVALNLPLEAKKSLGRAVELDPGNPFHNYAYGAVLAEERDPSQSIPYFEKYVKLRPADVRGRFALAVAHFLSNQFEEAKTRFATLAGSPETAAGARYFLGRIARQENRLDDAERELKTSLDLRPGQPDAHAELGQVYTRLRRFELAEQQLALALKLDGDHYSANVNLLALYQRTKDPRTAQQSLRVEEVKKQRSEKEQALWRTVEIRPY